MVTIAAVAFCGALGSIARYQLDRLIEDHTDGVMLVGTLIINVIGSLILGVFVGLHLRHGLSNTIELAIGTGFCGAFTTFSSLMYESIQLTQDGAYRQVARILSLNVVLGSFAAAVGLAVTGAF